jgi:hypothetical protein
VGLRFLPLPKPEEASVKMEAFSLSTVSFNEGCFILAHRNVSEDTAWPFEARWPSRYLPAGKAGPFQVLARSSLWAFHSYRWPGHFNLSESHCKL